jgi:hypothetical protein
MQDDIDIDLNDAVNGGIHSSMTLKEIYYPICANLAHGAIRL